MTKREFTMKMKKIAKNGDIEVAHREADNLMCQLLVELGYNAGVDAFRYMEKWYA